MPTKYTQKGKSRGLAVNMDQEEGGGGDWTGAAKGASALGGLLPLLGRAGGAISGAGGAAFGIMAVLQLLQVLGVGSEGGPSDRAGDQQAGRAFLSDPLTGMEGRQMALRQSLNANPQITGQFTGDQTDSDDAFLRDMMARHGQVLQQQMRRSPPTTAEIAMNAGLM